MRDHRKFGDKRECKNCDHYSAPRCHAHPPVRLPRKFVRDDTRERNEAVEWEWPVVQPTDRCGEFTIALADG